MKKNSNTRANSQGLQSRLASDLDRHGFTTAPVLASNTNSVLAEWGRWRDLERHFGIKRGTAYNLMAEGKIKAVVLRRKGNVHGCRLFHLDSVRQYLNQLLETQ